jgi:hypothetical protein
MCAVAISAIPVYSVYDAIETPGEKKQWLRPSMPLTIPWVLPQFPVPPPVSCLGLLKRFRATWR